MKKLFTLLAGLLGLVGFSRVHAQCTNVTLNWDYLDFLTYSGSYINDTYITSLAQAQTQHFAFGRQRLTINHTYTAATFAGENSTHTAETGSYGDDNTASADADVEFNGDGTITLTFEQSVTNLKFSLFDVDRNQRIQFDARNATNNSLPVRLTTLGTTILTLGNNNAVGARATALNSSVNNTSLNASFNVDIDGPVKTVTLTVSNSGSDPVFWLSNITACTDAAFPSNYYNVSRPFTGQPGYVLHAFDKSVYAVNPANGVTKLLFTDNYTQGAVGSTNRWTINSMAYDPYKKLLYYVYSLTDYESSNRVLKKYDFNTGLISTVLADVESIGIPTTSISGVESGAACFYDGKLYLGIETSNSGRTSGREATIWQIDFDASNVPYRASQLFAMPIDNGVDLLLHDWSDFVINDGILYNFDGAGANSTKIQTDVYQFNMTNGSAVNYTRPTGFTPGQPTVDWSGKIYNVFATTLTPNEVPYIALYNPANGTINTSQKFNITSNPAFTPAIPSLGDAAEAFKPKADFGDAPSSFDPDASSPAVHELVSDLRLGQTVGSRWEKAGSIEASLDGNDDGLPFERIISTSAGMYFTDVKLFNNTGSPATVAGWIDFNNNGIFDEGEGVVQNVASSPNEQVIQLTWTNIPQSLPPNSYTYLRLRISSATNGLTAAKATGYMPNGEVEDYRVQVNVSVLDVKLLAFNAQKKGDYDAQITWKAEQEPGAVFIVEKSINDGNWIIVYQAVASGAEVRQYSYLDNNAISGKIVYRLKIIDGAGKISYSQIKLLTYSPKKQSLIVFPNPSSNSVTVRFEAAKAGGGTLRFVDMAGRVVWIERLYAQKGINQIQLPFVEKLPNGLYQIHIDLRNDYLIQRLSIVR